MSPSKNWHLLGDAFIIKNTSKNRWFVPNCCTNLSLHKHWVFEVKNKQNFIKSSLYQKVVSRVMRKFVLALVEICRMGAGYRPLVTFQQAGCKGSRAAVRRLSCP